MRNLKFKAKKINSNEWVYGYYSQAGNETEVKSIIMPQGESTNELYEVTPETVCQLLCEKNGVEFFTGDILKSKQTFENSKEYALVYVYWNNEQLCYELKKINGSVSPPINWISNFDKVGNIYDNPELVGF